MIKDEIKCLTEEEVDLLRRFGNEVSIRRGQDATLENIRSRDIDLLIDLCDKVARRKGAIDYDKEEVYRYLTTYFDVSDDFARQVANATQLMVDQNDMLFTDYCRSLVDLHINYSDIVFTNRFVNNCDKINFVTINIRLEDGGSCAFVIGKHNIDKPYVQKFIEALNEFGIAHREEMIEKVSRKFGKVAEKYLMAEQSEE